MVLTNEERNALNKKLENPKQPIKCPRCGAAIKYQEFPTAFVAKCTTEGCIKKSLRGI